MKKKIEKEKNKQEEDLILLHTSCSTKNNLQFLEDITSASVRVTADEVAFLQSVNP